MPSLRTTSTSGPVGGSAGKAYWRSLDDFVDSPEFLARVGDEFPSQIENVISPSNRRAFLKLMGASLALAGIGLPGCRRWPDEKIAPFARRPENYVPGEPQHFATAWELGGVGRGLVATSFDGRPVKLEGNPLDPISMGSSDVYTQASILNFYDPERSRAPIHRAAGEGEVQHDDPWAACTAAIDAVAVAHRDNRGAGLAFLVAATSSPSFDDMRMRLAAIMPQAAWYEYESLSRDHEIEGARLTFGRPARAHFALDRADVIVCADSNLLHSHPAAAKHARDFAARRGAVDATMPRLYSIEGALSLTGANADHRLAVKSRDVGAVLAALAKRLAAHGVSVLGADRLPEGWTGDTKFIDVMARDLAAKRGRSIVAVGERQPAPVHAIAHAINFALGNVGATIHFTDEPGGSRQSHAEAIAALSQSMASGRVQTLVILGGNPVFDAPYDIDFAAAMAEVDTTIHFGLYDDETAASATWHVPAAHPLETWGDCRAWDGTVLLSQPLIDPLFGGWSAIETLARFAGDGVMRGLDIVRRTHQARLGEGGFERAWRQLVHDGTAPGTAWPNVNESLAIAAGGWTDEAAAWITSAAPNSDLEVVMTQSPSIYDGRFANNGWLQELPDPLGKICWDNAAFMSAATAAAIRGGPVRGDDLIHLAVADGDSLTVAAHLVPGMAEGVISIHLGYGRARAGHIGNGVGFDANVLRRSGAMHFAPCTAERGSGRHELATTQDHHAMDSRVTREGLQERIPMIIHEASLDDWLAHGKGALHHGHEMPIVSLWEEHSYEGATHRWAMAIDLTKCLGCNACVIACQAENNIPVVGKDQVKRGREMHWLRVDRYFKGPDTAKPEVVFQPVACVHCENAPCEQVCPVAATTHDAEGLNVMVYNRCVGTRYCSNNCPYKVRRFNFYNWHVEDPRVDGLKPPTLMIPDEAERKAFEGERETLKMGFNPEVTVRTRGVMEKCTFCVQRINRAKIKAKNAWAQQGGTESGASRYAMADGAVVPACAQACATHAIVFGDLNDPNSRVRALHRDQRTYSLLEELNTKPRTKYLGKVRNYEVSLKPAGEAGEGAHH
jgi:MoCo/4Fe-4S cofactor protein with predicted Tat translocation signal